MTRFALLGACAAASLLAACQRLPVQQNAEARQAQATATVMDEADRQTGMPAITHYAERKFARQVYEDRDQTTTTYAYVQGIDGRLTCLGHAIGYGIPYGTQLTNPQKVEWRSYSGYASAVTPQAEPNGLYSPESAEGTWLRMVDPATKQAHTVYIEPRVTVSPFPLTGPGIAAQCSP
jgi:hypothetical protein